MRVYLYAVPTGLYSDRVKALHYLRSRRRGFVNRAKKYPPHVTLVGGFDCSRSAESQLAVSLAALPLSDVDLTVRLGDVRYLADRRVLLIDVEAPGVMQLADAWRREVVRRGVSTDVNLTEYSTHLTLATRCPNGFEPVLMRYATQRLNGIEPDSWEIQVLALAASKWRCIARRELR